MTISVTTLGLFLLINTIFLPFTEAIVNGTIVPPNRYPFIVSLQWNGRHKCGGTLIDNETVLTVAHCLALTYVNVSQPHLVSVLIGTVNQAAPEGSDYRRVGVKSVVWLPNFPEALKGRKMLVADREVIQHDYLIFKLNESVEETDNIGYARLTNEDRQPKVGDICIPIGWGRYQSPDVEERTANIFPDRLRQGRLRIVDDFKCWRGAPPVLSTLCTKQIIVDGEPQGIPCFGDSGSPLVCKDSEGSEYVAGAVDAGPLPCNYPHATAIFVKIESKRSWIEQNSCCWSMASQLVASDLIISFILVFVYLWRRVGLCAM